MEKYATGHLCGFEGYVHVMIIAISTFITRVDWRNFTQNPHNESQYLLSFCFNSRCGIFLKKIIAKNVANCSGGCQILVAFISSTLMNHSLEECLNKLHKWNTIRKIYSLQSWEKERKQNSSGIIGCVWLFVFRCVWKGQCKQYEGKNTDINPI